MRHPATNPPYAVNTRLTFPGGPSNLGHVSWAEHERAQARAAGYAHKS